MGRPPSRAVSKCEWSQRPRSAAKFSTVVAGFVTRRYRRRVRIGPAEAPCGRIEGVLIDLTTGQPWPEMCHQAADIVFHGRLPGPHARGRQARPRRRSRRAEAKLDRMAETLTDVRVGQAGLAWPGQLWGLGAAVVAVSVAVLGSVVGILTWIQPLQLYGAAG